MFHLLLVLQSGGFRAAAQAPPADPLSNRGAACFPPTSELNIFYTKHLILFSCDSVIWGWNKDKEKAEEILNQELFRIRKQSFFLFSPGIIPTNQLT